MKQEITYRRASEDDYPAILELYNEMYKSKRNLNDFLWLVKDNPAGKAIIFIAIRDKKVVGIQSLIPYNFLRGEEVVFTYKSEDSLVKNDLRGKGIYTKLYKMVHEFTPQTLVWGLTDKKAILEKVAMPSDQRLTISVSVNRPGLIKERSILHRRVAKSIVYSILYLKSAFRTKRTSSDLILKEVYKKNFDNKELTLFFKLLTVAYPKLCIPFMDPVYLNWRLSKNPNLEVYKVFTSSRADGSIVVCSFIGFKGKSAYWQSFYSLPDASEEDELGHILKLKGEIFNSGSQIIHTWLFENNSVVKKMKNRFLNAGFSEVRKGLWIVNNSYRVELDVNSLYFSPQLGIR